MNEDYNHLVSSIATALLEEGPEVAAEGDKEGATTPDTPEEPEVIKFYPKIEPDRAKDKSIAGVAKDHPVLAAGALAGTGDLFGLINKIIGPHHFGSHKALRGETSGTGED